VDENIYAGAGGKRLPAFVSWALLAVIARWLLRWRLRALVRSGLGGQTLPK